MCIRQRPVPLRGTGRVAPLVGFLISPAQFLLDKGAYKRSPYLDSKPRLLPSRTANAFAGKDWRARSIRRSEFSLDTKGTPCLNPSHRVFLTTPSAPSLTSHSFRPSPSWSSDPTTKAPTCDSTHGSPSSSLARFMSSPPCWAWFLGGTLPRRHTPI